MTPPAARILGQGGENQVPGCGDCNVQGHVHGGLVSIHAFCVSFDPPAEAKQARRPAPAVHIDPTLVHLLQGNRVEVVPSLTAPLAAGDEP